jgi:hypothetical protein
MTYVALLLDNLHGGLLLEEEVLLQHLGALPLVALAVLCASWPYGGGARADLLHEELLLLWRSSSDLCADLLLGQHLERGPE